MTEFHKQEQFERLVWKLDPLSTLRRIRPLTGGVSAQVTVLEIERPDGRTETRVVRRHGTADLTRNPRIAVDEFHLLEVLHSEGLPTPAPYYLDESGEIFSTPYVVLEYVDGAAEFAPVQLDDAVLQMATQLARIHRVDWVGTDLSFLPQQHDLYAARLERRPSIVDDSLDEGRIRDTLESVWPLPPRNASVLLHGDFWPGNVLWKDGRLVAVIDWEDATLGDPLADLANSRLEFLWAFGIDAMQSFTNCYRSMTTIDFAHLPYWDLCAALRPAFKLAEWAGDDATEKRMREGHRLFITQAFDALSSTSPVAGPWDFRWR